MQLALILPYIHETFASFIINITENLSHLPFTQYFVEISPKVSNKFINNFHWSILEVHVVFNCKKVNSHNYLHTIHIFVRVTSLFLNSVIVFIIVYYNKEQGVNLIHTTTISFPIITINFVLKAFLLLCIFYYNKNHWVSKPLSINFSNILILIPKMFLEGG